MNKKILYIEISTAHTEIMASFIEAMTPENKVVLLVNHKSIQRLQFLKDKVEIQALNELNYLNEILDVKSIYQPDLILLNSSQGRKIRNLCLRLLFDHTPVIGVHHNAENIYNSFTQKLIHFKIKKYIVLADFIKFYLQQKINNKRIQIESFYPLIHPHSDELKLNLHKKYISIPGVLEQDRRDYLGLVEMVKKIHHQLDPEIQFVFLGNSKNHDGLQIEKRIKEYQLQSRFILFDQYVDDSVLIEYIQNSLAIMPLLHPGTKWFQKYFETKISGAYSLAFAFQKILFLHQIFEMKEEFVGYGYFYNEENFLEAIRNLYNKKVQLNKKFDFKFQKEKLLHFL